MAPGPCDDGTPPFRLVNDPAIPRLHPGLLPTLDLVAKVIRSDCWHLDLTGELPTAGTIRVALYLDELARQLDPGGRMARCAWPSLRTIARESRVAVSTVRVKCLPWLREHGWIATMELVVDGRVETCHWCLWLMPVDHAGRADVVRFDIGGIDVAIDRPDARPRRARFITPRAPISTLEAAKCAEARAPHPAAHRNARGIEFNSIEDEEKTTDRVNAADVVVCSPAAPGDQDGGKSVPPPPEPDPIDPRIVAELAGLPEPDRARAMPQIRAELPRLAARFPVERIVAALAKLVANRLHTTTIGDYGKCLAGILRNMQADDDLKRSRAPARPATTNQPSPAEADRQAVQRREIITGDDAWHALSAEVRAAMKADHDRDEPRRTGESRQVYELRRLARCKALLDPPEAVDAGEGSPAGPTVTSSPGRASS